MSKEQREHFHNFAVALQMLCHTYGVAIVNQDEYGMAIVPFPIEAKTPGLFEVYTIYPNGIESDDSEKNPVVWREDGQL